MVSESVFSRVKNTLVTAADLFSVDYPNLFTESEALNYDLSEIKLRVVYLQRAVNLVISAFFLIMAGALLFFVKTPLPYIGPLVILLYVAVELVVNRMFTALRYTAIAPTCYIAQRDSLTGLYEQVYFWREAQTSVEICESKSWPISFIEIGLDNFKWINDQYGRDTGNKVLKEIAKLLNSVFSDMDPHPVLGRIGGIDFGILLPNVSYSVSNKLAEEITVRIHSIKIDSTKLSASVGCTSTELIGNTYSNEVLQSTGDLALQIARGRGGNQAVSYAPDESIDDLL